MYSYYCSISGVFRKLYISCIDRGTKKTAKVKKVFEICQKVDSRILMCRSSLMAAPVGDLGMRLIQLQLTRFDLLPNKKNEITSSPFGARNNMNDSRGRFQTAPTPTIIILRSHPIPQHFITFRSSYIPDFQIYDLRQTKTGGMQLVPLISDVTILSNNTFPELN